MNVLVLGKGGREHAIAKALSHSPSVKKVFALPGRKGFEPEAIGLPQQTLEKESLKKWVAENNIELVIIGPEKELAEGLADFFRSIGILVFGPSQQAAKLESSKLFAKSFMLSAGIPTSEFKEVRYVREALTFSPHFDFPVVLKADGLAGGKGVFICKNQKELEDSAHLLFEKKIFGTAGNKALLEVFQKGEELSVFVLTNGGEYTLLPFVRDYKKLKENNKGPNTGGMGAFAPYDISEKLKKNIKEKIIQPSITEIKKNNLFYRGVLYIGLMIVEENPFVLEYNVRFGDPEAQVLLPLLDGDWLKVFLSLAKGEMPILKWKKNVFSACVVLGSEGYPSQPVTGTPIEGNVNTESNHSYFLHAGTKKIDKGWQTEGGRVLNALGFGDSKKLALKRAYEQADLVHWPGIKKRSDIGS